MPEIIFGSPAKQPGLRRKTSAPLAHRETKSVVRARNTRRNRVGQAPRFGNDVSTIYFARPDRIRRDRLADRYRIGVARAPNFFLINPVVSQIALAVFEIANQLIFSASTEITDFLASIRAHNRIRSMPHTIRQS